MRRRRTGAGAFQAYESRVVKRKEQGCISYRVTVRGADGKGVKDGELEERGGERVSERCENDQSLRSEDRKK